MLILCSNGLTSEALMAAVQEKLDGCITAALVVTADNEYKEKNRHVDEHLKELKSLNLKADVFDIDKQSPDLLLNYDMVEFIGGNPFYLLHSIRQNNAAGVLKNLASNKLLIGWSAAAFVFGPTLELVNIYSPEMNFMGLTDLSGLKLTDVEVLPHYSRFLPMFDRFEERCCAYEKMRNVKVIRISDGDGVIIDKDEVCVIRKGI